MSKKKLYDLTHLISMVGKDEGLKKMLIIFLESTPKILNELIEDYEKNNFEKIAQNAHKMKSSIDMMRIHSLSDDIRKIDKTDKVFDNIDNLPQIIEKIRTILNQVFINLKKEYSL